MLSPFLVSCLVFLCRSPLRCLARQSCSQFAHKLDVKLMPGAISNNVSSKIETEESEIANQVEYLVAGWFIAESQRVIDWTCRSENQQVFGGVVDTDARPAKLVSLRFKQESS